MILIATLSVLLQEQLIIDQCKREKVQNLAIELQEVRILKQVEKELLLKKERRTNRVLEI